MGCFKKELHNFAKKVVTASIDSQNDITGAMDILRDIPNLNKEVWESLVEAEKVLTVIGEEADEWVERTKPS